MLMGNYTHYYGDIGSYLGTVKYSDNFTLNYFLNYDDKDRIMRDADH